MEMRRPRSTDAESGSPHLENLRWATMSSNLMYRNENWQEIGDLMSKTIKKCGYDTVKEHLLKLLEEN